VAGFVAIRPSSMKRWWAKNDPHRDAVRRFGCA
jgi:hypothetical protein